MFHYRWYYSEDADNAATQLSLSMDVTLAEDTLQQSKSFFSERQVGRLGYVGSNDTTAPIIDASYRRLGWHTGRSKGRLSAMANRNRRLPLVTAKLPLPGQVSSVDR